LVRRIIASTTLNSLAVKGALARASMVSFSNWVYGFFMAEKNEGDTATTVSPS
jgi:hypothetical protein